MRLFFAAAFLLLIIGPINGQIRVNPTGVNVNSQNPTTVFLTFGQIPAGYLAVEAIWCGELIPANPPAIGNQCRPDTIFGSLPARYNLSTASGNAGFTDIMAIPPSVVRRAYEAAAGGATAGFFYVRRFVSSNGQPDQFVAVTCRLTSGGARVPFALTNVEIKTPGEKPILFIKSGEEFPKISATIQYNGTGRLKGRWEIVQPGEEKPDDTDLLTEATLPIEQRGSQKRFTQIASFNHFLPPVGKFELNLENPARVPSVAEGEYLLLLRIEASDDKESDSNLLTLGVGDGIVHSGAVASFPMPTLKFFVGGKDSNEIWTETAQLTPSESMPVDKMDPLIFSWKEKEGAVVYRLEVFGVSGIPFFSAILRSPFTSYRAPSWFWTRFGETNASWRVAAMDENGIVIGQTRMRKLLIRQ